MAAITGTDGPDVIGTSGNIPPELRASDSSDTISGLGGNDSIDAGGGDDTVDGGTGGDYILGNAGDDSIDGGDGDDTLGGGFGDDTIDGGEGNDNIGGDTGNADNGDADDILNGGSGDDQVSGDNGHDILHGDDGNDRLFHGTDWQFFGAASGEAYGDGGDDIIHGGMSGTYLSGGPGVDTLAGRGGNDTIDGGEDADLIWAGTGADAIDGGGGDDLIYTYGTINPNMPEVELWEVPPPDALFGRAVANPGGDAAIDLAHGGEGNDTVYGGPLDLLYGDAGDDILILEAMPARAGYSLLDGGPGVDVGIIRFSTSESVKFSVEPTTSEFFNVEIVGVENVGVVGSIGNDMLLGGRNGDGLWGGDGADTLFGGGGADYMEGGGGNDLYYVDRPGDTIVEPEGFGATDWLIVDFSAGSDVWNGGGGASGIVIGPGWYGGVSYATYHLLEALGIEKVEIAEVLGDALDELTSNADAILEVIANAFSQTMSGSPFRDRLVGMGGDDTLRGLAGNDVLDGGEGHDVLDGGVGNDTYVIDSSADEVIEPAGSGDNDTLVIDFSGGTANWPVQSGGGGAEGRPPGAGYSFGSASVVQSRMSEALGIETVRIAELVDGTLPADTVLEAFGNAFEQAMFGNAFVNHLLGEGGADTLDGGGGDDVLEGGTGSDSYVVDSPGDVIIDSQGLLDKVTVDLSTVAGTIEEPEFSFDNESGVELIELSANWSIGKVVGEDGMGVTLNDKANLFKPNLTKVHVDGGPNTDTVLFSDPRGEYAFKSKGYDASGNPIWVVKHLGIQNILEGDKTLRGFEQAAFGYDHVQPEALLDPNLLDLRTVQPNKTSNVAGSAFDDVLLQNASNGQVYFARMKDGAFQDWGAATGALGADWAAVASGNVNPATSDGAETFVQQRSTGTIYFASLDTGAVGWGVVSTSLTADWKLRAVADVNRDAAVDAIVQNATDGTIYFADMQGGAFHAWGMVNRNLTADWVAAGAGDVNCDGFADVIVQQQSSGTTYFADMAGGAFAGWGVVSTTLTADWKVKAVGDVTGDGFADVIFQNSAGAPGINPGTTYFADVSAGTVHWGVVTATVSADWIVQGTADVDNDGFAEVLFQNLVGGAGINPGTTYYADMGPNGFQGWGAVATSITADWHVV